MAERCEYEWDGEPMDECGWGSMEEVHMWENTEGWKRSMEGLV